MAHITLNTNTTTSPTALALPDNARIVIIDTDTNTETADLVISGAESLIVSDGDVQITTITADAEKTVADEKACAGSAENHNSEDHSAEGTETKVTETSEASDPATLTIVRTAGDVDPIYTIGVDYDNATGIYTDFTTGAEITADAVIDIIRRAYDNDATTSMTFDIPGHGVTTFTGDLFENYNGHAGITLVGVNGGAYVLNAERELTDDMTVLNEARFIFSGNPDVIFNNLDIDVIDGDINADTEDAGTEDCAEDCTEDTDTENCADEDTADIQRTQTEKTFYPDIPTFDADAKLYTKISSRSHNLKRYAIRRVINYAATHDLSVRLQWTHMLNGASEPYYVGRLQPMNRGNENANFLFVDKKFGTIEIDLDEINEDTGFDVLEIYSDTDMRRRGFAGTNHADYDEVSVNQMASHIITTLDV